MEKEGYRDVLEMLNAAFPGVDVLTMPQVEGYLHKNRRTLLQDKKFPAKVLGKKGTHYMIHKAALARYLA